MYKHEFGLALAFYPPCTFDDIDHFTRIMDGSPSVASPDEVQLFRSHMDHIVLMTKQGMTKMLKYALYASTAFAPHLNHVEMLAKAEEFYSAYDEGFGECIRYGHAWGPELAFYTTCGLESYMDFAAGVNMVMKVFEGRLATANLNIRNHRDHILFKVMD